MGLYLEKIEENEKKIKKLVDDNAHLSYLEIKAEYNCKCRELLEVLARERDQSAKLKDDSLTDFDVIAESADNTNSDDNFGQQMSFKDKRNPYVD